MCIMYILTIRKFVQIQISVFLSSVSEYLCRYCIIQVYKGIALCKRLVVRLNYLHRILMKLYANNIYVIRHLCELSPETIQSKRNMLFLSAYSLYSTRSLSVLITEEEIKNVLRIYIG